MDAERDLQAAPARAARLSADELAGMDAYWRAANYLSVGQIYLLDNPLLREPLRAEHVKPRLLGHWGTSPGLNFIYVHLNRVIRNWDLDAIYICGPGPRRTGHGRQRLPRGHLLGGLSQRRRRRGGPAPPLSPVLVSGRHPEPRRARDSRLDPRGRRARLLARPRLRRGLRQSRSAGRLRGRRRRGRDGAARGELALQQVPGAGARRRRAADPAPERLQDREPHGARPHERRRAYEALRGLRLSPLLRRGRRARAHAPAHGRGARPGRRGDPAASSAPPATASAAIGPRLADARAAHARRAGPGPKVVDGQQVEGTFRSHQVPLSAVRTNPEHLAQLETWLRSYRPEELFDDDGASPPTCAALPPRLIAA